MKGLLVYDSLSNHKVMSLSMNIFYCDAPSLTKFVKIVLKSAHFNVFEQVKTP